MLAIVFPVLTASLYAFTERQVLDFSLNPGERRDLSFPVPNSAVIFRRSPGFSALLGTGKGKVRQFGVVDGRSPTIGAYFGPRLGKVRIIARANCTVMLYALVPPQPLCEHVYISSGGRFEIGASPTANATDNPGQPMCLWRIGPPRDYHVTTDGFLLNDSVEIYPLAHPGENLIGRNRFPSNGAIDFFFYRSSRASRGRAFSVQADDRGLAHRRNVHPSRKRPNIDHGNWQRRA
jgi:hypothetical protein